MTIIFPKNNLPEPAQPWAREVQKQLASVIASDRSNEVNNAARDNQLNSSLISLTAAVNSANTAINGLTSLGSSGSSYTLNADNINGGTISGANFVTTSGTEKIAISGGRIYFSENETVIGAISADTDTINDYIRVVSASEQAALTIGPDYSILAGGNAGVQVSTVVDGRIDLTADLVFCNAALNVSGSVSISSGSITVSSVNGGDGTFNTALRSSNIPGNPLGSGAVDVYATSGVGRLGVQSSSRKTKQDIRNVEFDLDSLLSIEPKVFKYNVDVEEFGIDNTPDVVGFIAEELNELGLGYFVNYDSDGEPMSIPYSKYVVALQAVVRNLNDRITALENGA
jgi:hypothetical protein